MLYDNENEKFYIFMDVYMHIILHCPLAMFLSRDDALFDPKYGRFKWGFFFYSILALKSIHWANSSYIVQPAFNMFT